MAIGRRKFLFLGLAAVLCASIAVGFNQRVNLGAQKKGGLSLLLPEGARGRWVIVHFWASWCGPCLEEVPLVQKFSNSERNGGASLLAVSLDTSWEAARRVWPANKVGAGGRELLDPEQKMANAFGTFQLPETYLLDPQGQVRQKWVGAQDWSAIDLRKITQSP